VEAQSANKQLSSSRGVRGIYHIQTVNSIHSHFKEFLAPDKDVAKYEVII